MKQSIRELPAGRLRSERAALLRQVAKLDSDLQFIAEDRESELEERAQEEWAGRLVERLKERSRRRREEIDAALQQIADGRYGICSACSRRISLKRLRALPGTRYCVKCAREEEKARNPDAGQEQERENRASGRTNGDVRLLTDRELVALLRERLRADGRIDMEELRIICRHGVVYLRGALPSATEHRILLELVRDVAGVEEVIDRVQVEPLLWEREDRSDRTIFREPPPWFESLCTYDVVERTEGGLRYEPSAAPIPEEG